MVYIPVENPASDNRKTLTPSHPLVFGSRSHPHLLEDDPNSFEYIKRIIII